MTDWTRAQVDIMLGKTFKQSGLPESDRAEWDALAAEIAEIRAKGWEVVIPHD